MTEHRTVALVRDANEFPESHHANVHPDDVAAWEANGWTVAEQGDGANDPGAGPVEIPEGWAGLHHATRVKLAKALGASPANAAEADAAVEAEIARRAAEAVVQ